MNTAKVQKHNGVKVFATAAIVSLLLANCASTPHRSPAGAADVRAKLTRLQSDPNLGSRAPVEIKEAEAAVQLAETPVAKDTALGSYRVYLADYKVETAAAKAATRYAEDQRLRLSEEREHARLLARTREADMARKHADMARLDANRAREDADAARASEANAAANAARRAELARNESDRARDAAATEAAYQAELARNKSEKARALAAADAADAAERAERARNEADKARALAAANAADAAKQRDELQRQISLLEAKTTDRGLVLTLGNVLFATGKADLKVGATRTLDKLVTFLNRYPDRNAVIEGHTDNVGSSASNHLLSQRRAESVSSYLVQQGIASQRLAASGKGEDQPVADNDSVAGRQQNRRVEIIIDNPPLATAAMNSSM